MLTRLIPLKIAREKNDKKGKKKKKKKLKAKTKTRVVFKAISKPSKRFRVKSLLISCQ